MIGIICVFFSIAFSLQSIINSRVFIYWPIRMTRHLQVEFLMLFDLTSTIFLFTVILISTAVFIFRTTYISSEKFFMRFKLLLLSFVLSIGALIMCPNLITMLLGWDGLGVTSYLLVIYYNSSKSFNAGMVTAITNRLGDILIIMAAGGLIVQGSWISKIRTQIFGSRNLFQIFLIVGCFTKSAQIPFSSWLPAAIAAPTPVSSLVHSSTLVTAGVYVMIRHSERLRYYLTEDLVLLSGLRTIIIASLSALGETDIKKIVALSTLRQLGVIVTSLGIRCYLIAFMHLIIHAFFKAMIFIRTGNSIHQSKNYQSCRKTGFLSQSSPINTSSLVRGGIRLIGAPFAAAFFSKEPILEIIFFHDSLVEYIIILFGVVLTVLYTFRFLYFVLRSSSKIESCLTISEEDTLSNLSVLILFLPSFIRGVCISNIFQSSLIIKVEIPESWKLSVLACLALGVLVGAYSLDIIIKGFVQHDLIFIWSMPNFASSVTNYLSYQLGKSIVSIRFGWNLSIILITRSIKRERSLVYVVENSYIYRTLMFIPLSFTLVYIILYI